jgi:ABC-type antimicrobial peptide transport system permease subunit
VRILARADTPPEVLAALTAAGASRAGDLASVTARYDAEPVTSVLKLYLVVATLVLALAVTGLCAHFGVQLPGRRRDAASLRVIGVDRRALFVAAAVEAVCVLGPAVVAGGLAGVLGQSLVTRGLTYGYADTGVTPRVLSSLDVPVLALLVTATLVVLLGASAALAGLTVRSARAATLRRDGG